MKLRYTICFLRRGEEILMLNRRKTPDMGMWNGVGGKMEAGETPEDCILREVSEETGISLDAVQYRGIVTWSDGGDSAGWSDGMHLFIADLPSDFVYETPRGSDEGLLQFFPYPWIIHPDNKGVIENIRFFLPWAFDDAASYRHHCTYDRIVDIMGDRWQLRGIERMPLL